MVHDDGENDPVNLFSKPNKPSSKQPSVFFVTDSKAITEKDLSVFPPSNHENLFPSHFELPWNNSCSSSLPSSSSSSPLSSSPASFPLGTDLKRPLPTKMVDRDSGFWKVTSYMFRSLVSCIGSYFGCNSDIGNLTMGFSCGNAVLIAVAMWYFCVRSRRQCHVSEDVGHLLQIIKEKDEKIFQLTNQIVRMNELLLASHKMMATRLPDM